MFIIIILLFGGGNLLQAMYRPHTQREAMFYNKGQEWFVKHNKLEQQLEDSRRVIASKRTELASMQEKIDQAKNEIEQKDRVLIEMGYAINSLEEEIEKREGYRNALIAIYDDGENLKRQSVQLKVAYQKLQNELAHANKNNDLKDKALAELEKQNTELHEKGSQLSKEKKRLSAHFEGEIAGIASVSAQKHQEAVAALSELRKEISPLRRALSPLQAQVVAKDTEIKELKNAIVAMQSQEVARHPSRDKAKRLSLALERAKQK